MFDRAEKKDKEEAELDEFTRLKKLSARQVRSFEALFLNDWSMSVDLHVLMAQVAEIRKMITERDELLDASSGSGGKQVMPATFRKNKQIPPITVVLGDLLLRSPKELF